MASKANRKRKCEQEAKPHAWGGRKESLQRPLLNFHFCFAQMKQNTIGWRMMHGQLILIDDIPGCPAINVCDIYIQKGNTMLTEIGKIMITPFSYKDHDHSLLLWSVNDFWGLYVAVLSFPRVDLISKRMHGKKYLLKNKRKPLQWWIQQFFSQIGK